MRSLLIFTFIIYLGALASMVIGVFASQALAQTPEAAAPDFFINAEIENAHPYLGQQVTYIIRRYQAIDFPNPPHFEEHLFTGFWYSPLIQRPTYTTTITGREYRVHSTHLALFPTLVGALTIEPARLIIPGDGPEADTILESQSIDIQVRSLPANPPPHYTGAVGQFEISAWFNPEVGQVDQPMNLIVELKGTGNIKGLTEPILPDLEHWVTSMFGSQVETKVSLSKDFIKGSRRFTWMVVPRQVGEQFFPAIRFSYFDPQTGRYESIRTEPLPVTILSGETDSTFLSPAPVPRQEVLRLGTDIRHIKPVPESLSSRSVSVGPIFWVGIAISALTVGGVWLWHWGHLRRLDNSPPARRRRAGQQARHILATARQNPAATEARIYQALTGYLTDQLDCPIAGMTSSQLASVLNEARLTPALVDRIRTLLTQAEAGRFAPVSRPPEAATALLDEADDLLDDLEQFFAER